MKVPDTRAPDTRAPDTRPIKVIAEPGTKPIEVRIAPPKVAPPPEPRPDDE